MTLARNQIIPGKDNALAVVLIVSTSVTLRESQIFPPLAEGLIAESGDGISIFYLGYGVEIATYNALIR